MKIIRSGWDDELDEISDKSIYCEDTRKDLLENDQISVQEEAFMAGWNEAN